MIRTQMYTTRYLNAYYCGQPMQNAAEETNDAGFFLSGISPGKQSVNDSFLQRVLSTDACVPGTTGFEMTTEEPSSLFVA